MRKWINALPQGTAKEQNRKAFLEKELERSFKDLDNEHGPGDVGFVFAHCVRAPPFFKHILVSAPLGLFTCVLSCYTFEERSVATRLSVPESACAKSC